MSLNYNVQEHLIIDLDRAGAAGSAVWEALVEQVRALEDLLDEDEVCIYRLELWADGEPVPVDRKISCAGLGQALKGARRMEMVLRFNSTWRGTDAVYDDALPFDLTETAAQLTDEELDGIFCSAAAWWPSAAGATPCTGARSAPGRSMPSPPAAGSRCAPFWTCSRRSR